MLAVKVTGVVGGLICGAIIAFGWYYVAIGLAMIIGGTVLLKAIKGR